MLSLRVKVWYVMVRVCVRVGGEERGNDAWAFFHEERSDDAVDGVGMG